MYIDVPEPPDRLDPDLIQLPAETALWRVHPDDFTATQFNPNDKPEMSEGRFHPFQDSQGRWVATLYASDSVDGALSETIFHDLLGGGQSILLPSRYEERTLSRIRTTETFTLANLQGHGLHRLGIKRGHLLEAPPFQYDKTVAWAKAIHNCHRSIQGMVWTSRQLDTSQSIILFGDRIRRRGLKKTSTSHPLHEGEGFRFVKEYATKSDIPIITRKMA